MLPGDIVSPTIGLPSIPGHCDDVTLRCCNANKVLASEEGPSVPSCQEPERSRGGSIRGRGGHTRGVVVLVGDREEIAALSAIVSG